MDIKYNFLRFPGGKSKAVTLSYDDGSCHDIRFLETINKYGLKCTFNLVGKKIEKGEPLSREFIEENILARGHEIAAHGYDHRAQNKIRTVEGIREILDCRLVLERTFGRIVRGFAFPDDAVNRLESPDEYERIRKYLPELDVSYARSADSDNDGFKLPSDWYNWMPSVHHTNPEVMSYIDKFLSLDTSANYALFREPRLFYMWGHTSEFETRNSWELLDKICEKLSGADDVWFATNIEIYDYVEAYRSLKYSADGTIVYNPSIFDIWFNVNKTLVCIKSGEVLKLT